MKKVIGYIRCIALYIWLKFKFSLKIWQILWYECKNPLNLIFIGLWYLLFTCPIWIGWLLYFTTKNKIHLTYSNLVLVFWSAGGTPLIPLSITLGITTRKILIRRKIK